MPTAHMPGAALVLVDCRRNVQPMYPPGERHILGTTQWSRPRDSPVRRRSLRSLFSRRRPSRRCSPPGLC